MQFSLQFVFQYWKKEFISSCRRHVTSCNLELQLAMVSKNLCNRCNWALQLVLHDAIFFATCVAMELRDKLQVVQHVTCPLCNLSRNFLWLATIAQIRTGFYFLQRSHEAAYFMSPMSQWVWVKYILLCNSFVFSRIESIFAMQVLWDNSHQPHISLLWLLGYHGNHSDTSITLLF